LLEHFRAPGELGQVWHLSTSQLYAILKRLELGDFVIGRELISNDAPPRTEYQITEMGRERLNTWLHEKNPSASTRRIRTEFLSRLYIARLLDIPTVPIIQDQRTTCKERLETLLAMRGQAGTNIGFLSLDLSISEMENILRWIDRCSAALAGENGGVVESD